MEHKGKEVDGVEHEHVQMFSGTGTEVNQLDVLQPIQVACQRWLGRLVVQEAMMSYRGPAVRDGWETPSHGTWLRKAREARG